MTGVASRPFRSFTGVLLVLAMIAATAVSVPQPASAQSPEILLVTGTAGGFPDDQVIEGILQNAGYAVTVVDDNVAAASDADNVDVVLITTTASGSTVGSTFTNVTTPVINYEFQLHDDLGLTDSGSANRGEQGTFKAIDVVMPSHSIADGRSGGTDVFSSFSKVTWGKPGSQAEVVATQLNDPTRAVLFTYDPGALLADEATPAPGPRAGVFLAAASDNKLSSTGQDLLINTVAWAIAAAGPPSNKAPVVDAGSDVQVSSVGPIAVALSGSVTDDGLPGTTVTTTWTGPTGVTFDDDTSLTAMATLPGPGTYQLTLSGNDTELTGVDSMTVTVEDPNAPSPTSVLMVTANSTGTGDDQKVEAALVGAGLEVTIVADDQVTAADAIGHDVVLITTTASAFQVGSTFTDEPVPVVNYEQALHDDLELTPTGSANRGEKGGFRAIDVTNTDHPIALASSAAGSTEVFTASTKVTFGRPPASAETVAHQLNNSNNSVLFTFETGALLDDGDPAPARRAGAFPAAASDGRLTAVGELLLINTVLWAAGVPLDIPNQAPTVNAGDDVTVSSAGPVVVNLTGTVTDDGLPESASVSTTWSGPAGVTFDNPASLAVDATLPGPGVYDLTLSGYDTDLTGQDIVTVTVTDPNGPPTVLLVAGIPGGYADDQIIVGVLENAGFAVTVVGDDDVVAADADNHDVVVITATAAASSVGSTFTDVSAPVVNYEFQLHDDLGLTPSGSGNRGEKGSFRAIDIILPTHPIVDGYSGSTEVFSPFTKVTWGKPGGDVQIIANQLNDPTHAVLFTYEAGALLADGVTPAPGPRVGLFLAGPSDEDLNSDGEIILVNAVGWAAQAANLAPIVDAGADATSDASLPYDLAGSFVDDPLPIGSNPTVQWTGPAEVVFADDQSLTSSITFTTPGVYVLTLDVDDGLAVGTDTVTITASANTPPTAAGTVDTTTGASPLTVNVDATTSSDSDGTITSYLWDFGDGTTSTDATAEHTYVSAGLYPLTLTVTDNLGATDQVEVDTIAVGAGDSGWFDSSRSYRLALSVPAGTVDRIDRPAMIDVDFGQILAGLGATGTFDPASLRLVQINPQGLVVADKVPVQFDPTTPGADDGTLLTQIVGTLPANNSRQFNLYFDVVGGGYQQATFPDLVSLNSNATDEGLAALEITTTTGTYLFDKAGGGFTSLLDTDLNDWINYSALTGGLGEFRGFPNMIHPENQFHPGGTGVTTTVVGEGPLRTTFDVSVNNGAWAGQWQIFPTFARFDLTAADHDYWFLYEGTPGGTFEPATDVYVRSDGSSVPATTTVGTDIPGTEWAMAGDPNVGRSFFVAHDDDDAFEDSHFNFNGEMMVMSFGRKSSGVDKLLTAVPNAFTVGLTDSVTAATAQPVIDSSRLPLTGTSGLTEMLPLGSSAPATFSSISMAGNDIPTPPPGSNTDQTGMVSADFDRDGDDDVVIYGRNGPNSVQWYRRNAAGAFDLYVIESSELDAEAGGTTGDVDDDGDIDIIIPGDKDNNEIWWWENPGSGYQQGVDWVQRVIINTGPEKHHDVRFGDVDHDGQNELVYWTQGRANNRVDDLYVAEVPADPRAPGQWSNTLIYDATVASEGLEIADIDLDGFDDLIAGGRLFSYSTQSGTYSSVELSATTFGRYRAAQLIPGGRPEIVVASGDEIGGLDLLQWNGSTWVESSLLGGSSGIAAPWNRGHSLDIGDVNGDGNLDIFSAEMYLVGGSDSAQANARAVIWYGDGLGAFNADLVTTGRDNHESLLLDIDADGALDIVSKPFNLNIPALEVFFNQRFAAPAELDSWSKTVIDTKPARAMFIYHADLDGDGDDDLVTGAWWYENPGSITGSWTRHTIGSPLGDALVVDDLDGDGELDIFGARGPAGTAPLPRQFAWAKGDGAGNFTVFTNIDAGSSSFIQGATTVQFSTNGPKEIWLSWNERSNNVQKIVIPASPTTTQWTLQTGTTISQGEEIEFADIDGDGDLDLMEGHLWMENTGGGTSFTRHDLHTPTNCCFVGVVDTLPLPDRVVVADVNGDGRLDVVVSHEYDPNNRVVWYEQPANDPTQIWTEHLIGTASTAVHSLDVRDMDGDGDVDVVAGEHRRTSEVIENGQAWVFENTGAGLTWTTHLVDGADAHHDGMQLADLDDDGDLDIYSIGWEHDRVIIYENTTGGGGGPVDTDPPIISAVNANPSETSALVTWTTNEPADSTVDFGLTAGYGSTETSTFLRTSHAVTIPGLSCGETYHYQVSSADGAANSASSADATFSTSACGSDVLVDLALNETSGTNAADQSGMGNDGTLLNGAAFEAKTGGDASTQAVRFDGVDDAIDLGPIDATGSGLTMAAWFQADAFTGASSDGRIMSKASGVSGPDHVYMLSTIAVGVDVRLRARVRVGGSTTTLIASSGNLVTGQWYHAAATYDGSILRLYLDGVEVGAVALSGAVDVDNSISTTIGNQAALNRPFDGLIDGVAIYQRGLSAAEVQTLAGGVAGPAPLLTANVIDAARPHRAVFIKPADLDGDGDADLAAGAWWYENPGDPLQAWTRHTIGGGLNNVGAVYDFDGDGDADLWGTNNNAPATPTAATDLYWAENDGSGNFTIHTNIAAPSGNFLQGVFVGPFSTGGPIQMAVSWQDKTQGTQLFTIPAVPTTGTWTWTQISTVSFGEAVDGADLDSDGDVDLHLGEVWLENDGTTAWPSHTVDPVGFPGTTVDRVKLGDIDGDSQLDVVVGSSSYNMPGEVVWYEMGAVPTDPWTKNTISTSAIGGALSMDVADFDGDGDLDVIVGEHGDESTNPNLRLLLFENSGDGSSWTEVLLDDGGSHHDGSQAVDLDGDGDLDVASTGWFHSRVTVYINPATPAP